MHGTNPNIVTTPQLSKLYDKCDYLCKLKEEVCIIAYINYRNFSTERNGAETSGSKLQKFAHSHRWSNRALNYCYEWTSTVHFYPHKGIDLLNLPEFYRASFSLVCTNEQMVDGWLTNKSVRLTFVLL